ncbi:MAG: DotI/IcmL family type IV secretion protein [Legionella sp.]|jgi:hypothetical protein
MKKTMLCSALCLLVSYQLHAEADQQFTQQQLAVNNPTAVNPTTTAPAAPVLPNVSTQAPAAIPVIINCDYKIPAETKQVEQGVVIAWTEKAIIQAFDFDSATIDGQMQKLQSCFTDQGWQGFNNALQKSGNIEAIKTQKLTVSSQLDGRVDVLEVKDNQWKIAVPLQVVYQNDKEKVTQLLHLKVTIGRKVSGDLGIMQMVATPRTDASNTSSEPSLAPNNQPNTASIPVQNNTGTSPSQPNEPNTSNPNTNTNQDNPGQHDTIKQEVQPALPNNPNSAPTPAEQKPATDGTNPNNPGIVH